MLRWTGLLLTLVAVLHNLVAALNRQRRYGEAMFGYRKALALDPKSPTVRTGLTDVLLDQGRFVEAQAGPVCVHATLCVVPRPC